MQYWGMTLTRKVTTIMLLLTDSPAVAFVLLLTLYPGISNKTIEPNGTPIVRLSSGIEQNRTQSNSIRFDFLRNLIYDE